MKYVRYPRMRMRRTENPESHERLERFKRWPHLKQKWVGKKVYIWSAEHGAYWRPDGAGYTVDGLQAGVYDFEDAYRRTSHCGAEKRIEYKVVNNGK